MKGQLAVAQRNGDTLTGFTGVQIPGVLDDLYADALEGTDLGVAFRGNKPDLPPLGADRAERDPADVGCRCHRRTAAS